MATANSLLHLLRPHRSHRSILPITCGPRDNRAPLQRGRVLSSEAILAVQSLKRAHSHSNPNPNPNSPFSFPDQAFSRLLKPDLVAAIAELQRQNRPHLALLVFSYLRRDPSYKPDLSLYASMISSFSSSVDDSNGASEIDHLVSDLIEEKERFSTEDTWKLTRVVKCLIKAGRRQAVWRLYEAVRNGGFVGDEYFFRVLVRGLKRLGEETLAREVERDFEAWWYNGALVVDKKEMMESV